MRARMLAALGCTVVLLAAAQSAVAVTVGIGPSLSSPGGAFVIATQPFAATLGQVTPCTAPTDYTATIEWGDGSGAPAAVVPRSDGNGCDLTASRTFPQVSAATVLHGTVTAVPAAGGDPLTATYFTNVTPWAVRNIQAAKSNEPAVTWNLLALPIGDNVGAYVATIDWGDGTTSDVPTQQGWVRASHIFPAPGAYPIGVDIKRDGLTQAHVGTRAVIANCGERPLAPAPAFVPAAGSPTARWLAAVYQDLLGRPIDAAALAHLGREVGLGATRADVVRSLQASAAYRAMALDQAYVKLLGRDPTEEETEAFLRSSTYEQALLQAALSSEYSNMLRSTDPLAFFDTFVCDALDRPTRLGQGVDAIRARGLRELALAVLGSSAYAEHAREAASLMLLRRRAAPGSYAATDLESAEAGVAGSRAYWERVNGRGVFGDVTVTRGVLSADLRRSAALDLVVIRAGRRVGVERLGPHGTGLLRVALRAHRIRSDDRLILRARIGRRLVDQSDAV